MPCPAENVAMCKDFFINGMQDILDSWEIVDVDPKDARANKI